MADLKTRVQSHCAQINRCNQRGGRMLSIFDLLEAETLGLDLAAYLMARISHGASFMVGARPGGAGKTAVMGALLNLIPAEREIVAATAQAVRAAIREDASAPRCYVCHEIGAGPYFAYLWGSDLRAYCSLAEKGHLLASNLHADDLDEARAQVCDENGVPRAHFNAFRLLVFLRVEGGWPRSRRRIDKVYESDGARAHALVYDSRTKPLVVSERDGTGPEAQWIAPLREFLEKAWKDGVRTIEETRKRFLEFAR